jgi:hypothetical protein
MSEGPVRAGREPPSYVDNGIHRAGTSDSRTEV